MKTSYSFKTIRKDYNIDFTMDVFRKKSLQIKMNLLFLGVCLFSAMSTYAQVPDPNLGTRVDWMRGSLGLLWLPENNYNGNIEGVSIDGFLNQIQHLKTVDFVQVGLASPYIYSPVHTAPHTILESLWQGDLGPDGQPINLVVPRASVPDPFLSWLKAIKAAGLKTEVYVNSANLLQWEAFGSAPEAFPDFSDRWKEYCDTNPTVQAFINSKSYHIDGVNDDRRPYMFSYAEFILKDYAMRYGDLIDAWCFDAAHVNIGGGAGDDYSTGNIDDQRVFQAFADAVHAGNPQAGVTFNNGIGDRDSDPFIPYVKPSLFEDYKFGHPFGGAGNMVEPRDPLYRVNFGICEYMRDTNGFPYTNDDISWNDNVVAHFFPKQSTSSWNDGGVPCLTDEEFVEWNNVGLINGGGITWGTPLMRTNLNNNPELTLQPYALRQLELVDANLSEFQFPGAPNWARQYTILSDIIPGQNYEHILVEGEDFWDPENVGVTNLSIIGDEAPAWLTITETEDGVWTLKGTPTETENTAYTFELKAEDIDGGRNREVTLKVKSNPDGFTNPGDGSPVWKVSSIVLENTSVQELFEYYLEEGVDFYDFEDDDLNITVGAGEDWLTVEKLSEGIWYLSGTPEIDHVGDNIITLNLSDGSHSTDVQLQVIVDPLDTSDGVPVEIKATPTTNYGIGEVATMISETQIATDGLATYKIAIDVTPPSEAAVISGLSGGVSTEYAWGLGDGTNANSDDIFTGSDNDWVKSINNIQIIDFSANGSLLSVEDITAVFKSVIVVNAQSANDRVSLKVDEVITNLSRLSSTPEEIFLDASTGIENITDFAIGVGNASATNKWSVEGINVLVKFDFPTPDLELVSLITTPLLCADEETATATVKGIGGQPPYSYLWSDGQENQIAEDLAAGDYFVEIKDQLGNTLTQEFTINAIEPIVITMIEDQDINVGYLTEMATLEPESIIGGTGDYTYVWSTGETTSTISVSPEETTTYTLTVTDENGCSTSGTIIVNVTDVSCGYKGYMVQVCYKGKSLCLPPFAVNTFLRIGATLGGCGGGTAASLEVISVFPNPMDSETTIKISSSTSGNGQLQVVDILGRVRLSNEILLQQGTSNYALSLSGFRRGIYFVIITANGQKSKPFRIIKK
ncbi:T9SS type A sorting domain-containing protein [Cellulophaga sp. L1A9]|uniref:T9SS type A sorting domain-containing protein n=1 Tax=Cellulophaga sp. L1A9 TaxID=2686362 RepID=UPI00131CE415|nr:T9SS type A sorting domain-containing protein [Cellulophaga sp. L1A9]